MRATLSFNAPDLLSLEGNCNRPRKNQTRLSAKTRGYNLFIQLLVILVFSTSAIKAQDLLLGLTSNGGPEGKGTAYSIKTDTKAFNVVKSFANWGENPVSALVRGSDGYLYGMTPNGGTYGFGTIFKISTTGQISVLKNFDLNIDGGYPKGSLIQATDGNFWGMTSSGPNSGGGAIFKITPDGQYTVVRALSGSDGGWPQGRLVQATDGFMYGITRAGGSLGYGTIFRVKLDGTFTVLKSLNGTTEGKESYGSLMQASDGAFYGMTKYGGTYGHGVIFCYSLTTGYKVLKHLNGSIDAAYPSGDLVQGKDGFLYGMSPSGVSYNGVIFKINTSGTVFSKIHDMGTNGEGGDPTGSLVLAADGYFYGLTPNLGGGYSGSIFKMNSSGTVTPVKKLLEATDGGRAAGSLIQLPDGNFYGMTQFGGKNANGTIFKVTSGGTLTVLANMNGALQGNVPQDNMVIGKDSAYFGVTQHGGTYFSGTIFKICNGTTTTIRSFNRPTDGGYPTGGLVRGADGNLYGTTAMGGTNGAGTIYKLSPATGQFTVIRHLTSTTDGNTPNSALVQGADGYFYGTTNSGGTNGGGTIFKINSSGSSFIVLRQLVSATDGSSLEAGLVAGSDGNFYGITGYNSRFFKVTKDGVFTPLKTFSYSTDGNTPAGNLILGKDGYFYGTMSVGGAYGKGVIFKINTAGSFSKLRDLNGTTDGGNPRGSLVQGSDGAFYGTNSTGGTNKAGTIFRILGTSYSILRNLNIATDGGAPLGGLIIAPKVNLIANPQSGLTTNEDVAKALTLTGYGAPNLTFTVVTQPKNGTINSGTSASRTYKPKANYYGVDSFAFTANLGCLTSAPAWVKISVSPVNDAPVLTAIGNKSIVKGTQLKFTATAKDVDPAQPKIFSLITPPSGAVIGASTGVFTWTPSVTGTYTVTVRVSDNVLYDEETITITVTAPPVTTARVATESITEVNNTSTSKSTMYPNPVSNSFTLNPRKTMGEMMVTIFDLKGSVVTSQTYGGAKQQQIKFETDKLKPGQYLLQIKTIEGIEVLKFIKM